MRIRHYLSLVSAPLLFLGFYLSLSIIWRVFHLPPAEELVVIIKAWFDAYGSPILFFGAMLEGMLLVGNYFPGVFVIFIAVVVAGSPAKAALAVVIATAGLLIAHTINYFLGKHGWYRLLVKFGMKGAIERAEARLTKKGPLAILLSYWSPSFGALMDTAAGIIRLPFKTFFKYSVGASIFWNSLVGIIVYLSGDSALKVAAGGTGSMTGAGSLVVYTIDLVWMAVLIIQDRRSRIGETSNKI